MKDSPKRIRIAPSQVVNKDIDHRYVEVPRMERDDWVANFLSRHEDQRGLVFGRTKASVIKLSKQLAERDFPVEALHGDLTQAERDKIMRGFKNERLRVIVATDVAARGIDVDDLAFVVQYQLPDHIDQYTHRAGRTARAGRKGTAIVLIDPREKKRLRRFEDELGIEFERL